MVDLVRWLGRVLPAYGLLVLIAAVGGLLVAALTAASADVYEAVVDKDGVAGLDAPALEQALGWRSPRANQLVTGFTTLGGPLAMSLLATALTAAMVWRWRSWTPLVMMGCAVAGSLTFTTVGKAIVGRARPPLSDAVPPYEYAFSFPSGHTLNSTVIAGMVAYLVARHLRHRWTRTLCVVSAVVWSVAMGLSRVFLGHHWLTDVIFAWLLGLAWLTLLVTAHRIYLTYGRSRGRPRRPGLVAAR